MHKAYLLASLSVCLFASASFAGGTSAPFYVGGSFGVSSYDNSSHQMDNLDICKSASSHNQTCTSDDNDHAGHIYGGLQIGDSLSLETGYVNLGNTANYHYSDPIAINQRKLPV